ncbi:alpha/beta fold hydrolase [Amycolatopsis sp. NPDC059021]|uniref:alpha/beta fold hydrolase n=1 Tax=Amycolatopsis sp. NPDC059021 TaxID=3346704 RepID=UPI00366B5488
MHTAISRDGTKIAYDRTGDGPALILVSGAFGYRTFPGLVELAGLLAGRFTVYNYDRRGRGDSGDTAPYSPEREIEDLQAVVDAAGGEAYVWGLSSGAVLALKAATHGVPIKKLALYEPPFVTDASGKHPPADFLEHLRTLIRDDERAEAVKYFMTKGMGAPWFVILIMRAMRGVWQRLADLAHTLPYDAELLDGHTAGEPLRAGEWAGLTAPALVLDGAKSPAALRKAAKDLAAVLPGAKHRSLEGRKHTVSMAVLAPVLIDYFAG